VKPLTPEGLSVEAAAHRRRANYEVLQTRRAEGQALTSDEQAVLGPVVAWLDQLLAEGHTIDTTVVTRTLLARRRELNAILATVDDDELRELLIERAAARATNDLQEDQ
jgi:hypothetical protein